MHIAPITSASPAQQAASAPISSGLQAVIAGDYSTTVSGKTYGAYVEQGHNGYEARVPNLLGADATGASVREVEYNLGNIISFLA